MRKIHNMIFIFILLAVCLLVACEKNEDQIPATTYDIDWREYTPKKEMVMYFEGGFEMGGHITAIEYMDEENIIKREINDGATALTLEKIYDGLAVSVLNHMPDDFESFSAELLLKMPYTPPNKDNLVYETKSQKWEESKSDGKKVQKEVISMDYPIEINGIAHSGIKIRETEENEGEALYVVDHVYVKAIGRVSTEFIHIDKAGKEEILHYERILRIYEMDKEASLVDLKKTLGPIQAKYEIDFVLPSFYGSPYAQSFIFGMNPNPGLDKKVSYKNVVLDYKNEVFKSFEYQYDEVLNAFSYVYDTVIFNQSGNLNEGMLVYVQKQESKMDSLYLYKGHAPLGTGDRWTFVEDFEKENGDSPYDLSPDALTAALVSEDILYFKEGTLYIKSAEKSLESYQMPKGFSPVPFEVLDHQIWVGENVEQGEKLFFNQKSKTFEIEKVKN